MDRGRRPDMRGPHRERRGTVRGRDDRRRPPMGRPYMSDRDRRWPAPKRRRDDIYEREMALAARERAFEREAAMRRREAPRRKTLQPWEDVYKINPQDDQERQYKTWMEFMLKGGAWIGPEPRFKPQNQEEWIKKNGLDLSQVPTSTVPEIDPKEFVPIIKKQTRVDGLLTIYRQHSTHEKFDAPVVTAFLEQLAECLTKIRKFDASSLHPGSRRSLEGAMDRIYSDEHLAALDMEVLILTFRALCKCCERKAIRRRTMDQAVRAILKKSTEIEDSNAQNSLALIECLQSVRKLCAALEDELINDLAKKFMDRVSANLGECSCEELIKVLSNLEALSIPLDKVEGFLAAVLAEISAKHMENIKPEDVSALLWLANSLSQSLNDEQVSALVEKAHAQLEVIDFEVESNQTAGERRGQLVVLRRTLTILRGANHAATEQFRDVYMKSLESQRKGVINRVEQAEKDRVERIQKREEERKARAAERAKKAAERKAEAAKKAAEAKAEAAKKAAEEKDAAPELPETQEVTAESDAPLADASEAVEQEEAAPEEAITGGESNEAVAETSMQDENETTTTDEKSEDADSAMTDATEAE